MEMIIQEKDPFFELGELLTTDRKNGYIPVSHDDKYNILDVNTGLLLSDTPIDKQAIIFMINSLSGKNIRRDNVKIVTKINAVEENFILSGTVIVDKTDNLFLITSDCEKNKYLINLTKFGILHKFGKRFNILDVLPRYINGLIVKVTNQDNLIVLGE